MLLDEEVMGELKKQMHLAVDLAIDITPKYGKIYKALYDSLVKEGFTEEQAMQITCNYKAGGENIK